LWDLLGWVTSNTSSDLRDFLGWVMSNTASLLLLFLIIATVLTPMIIYILERRRIPKLQFAGFFRSDGSEVGTTGVKDITRFFVKVINVNKRSEGKTKECMGFVSLDNKTYRSDWQDGYAGNTFGKEALLQVFFLNKKSNTINFSHTIGAGKTEESKSYDECIHNNISIRLECERGQCPKPLTERTENIINNAVGV